MSPRLSFVRIPGLAEYRETYARQLALRDAVALGELCDTVLLLEHAPVITLGRKANPEHILAAPELLDALGVDRVAADRGGDVTYHGPGQFVAYPILNLSHWRLSIGWYLRSVEQVIIDLLGDYGLTGERLDGFTGVWVRGAKVAAIGVAVHQWVTLHGLALNVNPDMRHWNCIIPCGIADKPITSLAALLGTAPPMPQVMERFETHFSRVFGASPTSTNPNGPREAKPGN